MTDRLNMTGDVYLYLAGLIIVFGAIYWVSSALYVSQTRRKIRKLKFKARYL